MAAMTLFDLPHGSRGTVSKIEGENRLKRRLSEMGLVKGAQVEARQTAPLGDPRLYAVAGFQLSLRNEEARSVLLEALAS
ncbi:MAG: ferrous iron transport protein A [Magnetococcales bacterium]|nr:ferrous iron transport protein A [Magnetococcales bacterium]MBF0114843.1 ferrous iron transport protein A [Magnetococcales bacterium]